MTIAVIEDKRLPVARAEDFPRNADAGVKVGNEQIVVYNFVHRDKSYVCQNTYSYKHGMVLARELISDQDDAPKVAYPQHKKIFSLLGGQNLNGEDYCIKTYPVKIKDGFVYVNATSN